MLKRRKIKDVSGKAKRPVNVKKIVIICVAAALVIAMGVFFAVKKFSKKEETKKTTVARVTRATISNVLEGSGTLEAIDQYEVSALVSGDVLEDYFEEGDQVSKDQVLYKVDSSSVEKNISKAQNSLSQSRMSYNEALDNANDLTLTAPHSGMVSQVYVHNGDDVKSGDKICDIIDNDNMLLDITFLQSQAGSIYSGQSATVEMLGGGGTYSGTVKSVASGTLTNSLGVPVVSVEISVPNPGGIVAADTATALVGNIACASPGTFKSSNETTVTVKAAGKINGFYLIKGDRVSSGQKILNVTSASVSNQVSKSALSLSDSELSLANLYDDLDQYSITSPIAGKVIQKTVKAGDKIASQQGSTAMAVIADLSAFTMTMSIDELDISSVKVGQEVQITADALEGQVFSGVVNNVSIVGTSSNGVTTYPVEVLISDVENTQLIPGMNVSATIVIEKKDDVLVLPTTAINRGNKVTKSETNETVEVETGLNDGKNVEILSGLNEGDSVVITEVIANSSSQNNVMGGMGGMHSGGMSGGMPSGGMGGGMSSGGMGGGMPSGGMSGGTSSAGGNSGNRTSGGGGMSR